MTTKGRGRRDRDGNAVVRPRGTDAAAGRRRPQIVRLILVRAAGLVFCIVACSCDGGRKSPATRRGAMVWWTCGSDSHHLPHPRTGDCADHDVLSSPRFFSAFFRRLGCFFFREKTGSEAIFSYARGGRPGDGLQGVFRPDRIASPISCPMVPSLAGLVFIDNGRCLTADLRPLFCLGFGRNVTEPGHFAVSVVLDALSR